MTNPSYTHITVVVDRSGSMSSIRADAEGGLRAFLDEQRRQPGTLTTTVVQFDDRYDEIARMSHADPLHGWSLEPRGMTALLDAMGRAIATTGQDLAALPEGERPGQVYVVVVTDGHENASTEWTRPRVFDAVTHQSQVYGWRFVYTAAGQDAIGVARDLGIDHAMNYDATGDGVRSNYASLSSSVTASRGGFGFAVPERAS